MPDENAEIHETIKGSHLDDFLARGWYRSGFMIFTTHFISPFGDNKNYRVYWLRYLVSAVQLSKKTRALLAANKEFTIACHPFRLTAEVDGLHKLYASQLKFDANTDLSHILLDIYNQVFDSHIIEVRHNGKLIAFGIFDKGQDSIAGIINVYDPAYKKYSPGKFIMLQKYLYCLHNNIPYYYPGYFSTDHPVFDYKLFIDKAATEVYLPGNDIWIGYNIFRENL